MTDYAPTPLHRCPRCNSPSPELHPAVQFEGEVVTCIDDYHLIPTNMNAPRIAPMIAEPDYQQRRQKAGLAVVVEA